MPKKVDILAILSYSQDVEEQYDFSEITYETIGHESTMPFKTFFISVGYRGGHWHREFEIILILEGELTITNGRTTHYLKKGDLYIINPYEMHGIIKGNQTNLLLVLQVDPVISSACPTNLNRYNFKIHPDSNLSLKSKEIIKKYMTTLMRETLIRKEGYEYVCMGTVNLLVSVLIRKVLNQQDSEKAIESKTEWIERLNKILEYINLNYQNDPSLEDLAELTNLSTFYVSHLIKEHTGLSFRENLSMIRTHHAINLMLSSDRKLIDIALDAGFSDVKYFNRNFKKIFGDTPSNIRRRDNWKTIIQKQTTHLPENTGPLLSLLDKIT